MKLDPTSILFVTLDSCRYDTFASARTPNFDAIGELHRAMAPGSFTFASHSAMFMGHTPGIPGTHEPYTNPRYGQIFRLAGGGTGLKPFAYLRGRNIMEGLRRLGYLTVGVGAVRWFNPRTLTSRTLVTPFDEYFYPGNQYSLRKQLTFVNKVVERVDRPLFLFMNIGETHIPYWHDGANWSVDDNPCEELSDDNDAEKCRQRQKECLEWVDTELHPVLDLFDGANVIITADHGDAWGEDGLWGHGFHHHKVLEVPLIHRLVNPPPNQPARGGHVSLWDRTINKAADRSRHAGRRMRRAVKR